MATLPEESKFDEGVYQIELTDSVVGGPNGISNAPLRSLANRTRWLKDKVAELVSSLGGKADKVHAHTVATPSSPGFMSAADKTKLDGVASGAQANTVTSVAGRSGAVALTVGDVSGAAPKASPRFSGVVAIDAGTTVDFNHEQGAKVYVPAKKAGDLTAPEAVSKYTLTDYAAPLNGARLVDPTIQPGSRDGWITIHGSVTIPDSYQGYKAYMTVPNSVDTKQPSRDGTGVVNTGWIARNIIDSPQFSGKPKAPNPQSSDNSDQIATTSWVRGVIPSLSGYATRNSPALTGAPTAPTPAISDQSDRIATTNWVRSAIATIADSMGMVVSPGASAGFIRFPRWLWGVTIQWARVESSQRGHLNGSWAVSFPVSCFMVVGSPRFGSLHAPVAVNGDNTKFYYEAPGNTSGNPIGFHILAIGR